jgi:superfamily II DNA or RNA helicase
LSFRDLNLSGFYTAGDDRLTGFYIPVLKEAVAYDRLTGYFKSTSLVVAAAGLSYFIGAGSRMRLIVGADLTEEDVRAMTEGEPLPDVIARRLSANPVEGIDIVSDRRLEVLAYMAKTGQLEIKVGVPLNRAGRPLTRQESDRYFHSKYGVLRDSDGNRVAFIGSDNESASGWRTNHESFTVAKSWMPEVWAEQGKPICATFERHWQHRPDAGWAVVDLPAAVHDRLIKLVRPDPPPRRDPEEGLVSPRASEDQARLAFVRAAPLVDGGTGVGLATSGIEPWPHQLRIAERVVATFPRSYLLADEVGLGKTIEAGLVLRELLISGRAQTALLLVPASVARQWQEELLEKFSLSIPRYDGRTFWEPGTTNPVELPWSGNPWRAFPVVIATSHLARRRSRREEILSAAPWDVVLVDEAHHARRRGSSPSDTPNTLLSLLRRMKDARAWRSLYLASATPMQMHPHEAWDLLHLLGLTRRWAEDAAPFIRYYTQLREPFDGRDWEFLARMSRDFFDEPGVEPDATLERNLKDDLGLAGSAPVRDFHRNPPTRGGLAALSEETRQWMNAWLRAHTPMHDRVFRTTRNLLRQYKALGILSPDTVIPRRIVRDRFIPMTPGERELYQRIESYILRTYNAYLRGGNDKQPLGFIMTIYRRRLTSSFHAIERSLAKRLRVLQGNGAMSGLLDEDDLASLEGTGFVDLEDFEGTARALAKEIVELERFIADLAERPPDESKMARLHDELHEAFVGAHDTALIFTQYTDTMDYIREQLLPVYGSKVACYSGRGAERWDPEREQWHDVTKTELKRLFREGAEVKILIGTDSLSEGLNLQTCAKLVNYDMPWNFMRVEQRIGRIDRIGGREEVEISNYFYEGTVEEQIYQGIGEDFDWFEDVVGPAQPVLGQVERAIEEVAMEEPGDKRDADVRSRVGQIREQIAEAQRQPVTLADLEGVPATQPSAEPAITLGEVEEVLTSSAATAELLQPHPEIPGAYVIDGIAPGRGVTMRRAVLDEWAPRVRLLTYLTPEFDRLLAAAGVAMPEFVDGRPVILGRTVGRLRDIEEPPPEVIAASTGRLTIAEQVGELPLDDRL